MSVDDIDKSWFSSRAGRELLIVLFLVPIFELEVTILLLHLLLLLSCCSQCYPTHNKSTFDIIPPPVANVANEKSQT